MSTYQMYTDPQKVNPKWGPTGEDPPFTSLQSPRSSDRTSHSQASRP